MTDMALAIDALLSRTSAPRLGDPAPPDELINVALKCGLAAPDHGRLRPWRLLAIRGAAREALGELFAKALLQRSPDAAPGLVQSERQKPLRAPLIIVVGVRIQSAAKIPVIEQVMAGAAAAQNILLAFHAAGFGCMWKTGEAAYDPLVKSGLGFTADDHIVAFLHIGTRLAASAPRQAASLANHAHEWLGLDGPS